MKINKLFRQSAEIGVSMTIIATLLAGCLGGDGGVAATATTPLVVTPVLGQVYSGQVTVTGTNGTTRSYSIVSGVPSITANIAGMTAPLLIELKGDPANGNKLEYFDEGTGLTAISVVNTAASAVRAIVPSLAGLSASGVGVTPLTEISAATVANASGIVNISTLSAASAVGANTAALALLQKLSGSTIIINDVLAPPTPVKAAGAALGTSAGDTYAKVLNTLANLPATYGVDAHQKARTLSDDIKTSGNFGTTGGRNFDTDVAVANATAAIKYVGTAPVTQPAAADYKAIMAIATQAAPSPSASAKTFVEIGAQQALLASAFNAASGVAPVNQAAIASAVAAARTGMTTMTQTLAQLPVATTSNPVALQAATQQALQAAAAGLAPATALANANTAAATVIQTLAALPATTTGTALQAATQQALQAAAAGLTPTTATANITAAATALQQNTSSIAGSWMRTDPISGNASVVTFFANGDYFQAEKGTAANGGSDGVEFGTYAWDSATGALTTTCASFDSNGSWGLSTPTSGATACSGINVAIVVSPDGNTATVSGGNGFQTITETRVVDAAIPIIGSWVMTTPQNNKVLITFLPGGSYIQAEIGMADAVGQSGFEVGTYTWNATTGAFATGGCPAVDTNGQWGLSHPYAAMVGHTSACEAVVNGTVRVNGNLLSFNDGYSSGTLVRLTYATSLGGGGGGTGVGAAAPTSGYAPPFDGTYTSTLVWVDGYTHTENVTVTGNTVSGTHAFTNYTCATCGSGSFAWTGTIIRSTTNPSMGTITGNGTINNGGTRTFTLDSGTVIINPDGSADLGWLATDPTNGQIGGGAHRQ